MAPKFLPTLRGGSRRQTEVKVGVPVAMAQYYASIAGANHSSARDWPVERAVAEGYDRVMWVFKSVNTIAADSARLAFRLREGDDEDSPVVEDHPLYRVLNKQANPLERGPIFRKRLSAQILLSKKGAFVEITKSNGGSIIRVDLLPPDRVQIIPDSDGGVDHYELTKRNGGGVKNLDPDKVRWFRDPHPLDPYMGVTPLESAGMSIELDHFARMYNVAFLRNDGRPGGILAVRDTKGGSGDIDPAQMDRIESRFGKGPVEAGKLSVVAGALDYVDLAAKPRDMQYGALSTNSRMEILGAFGIGESVFGNASGRTFDNADNELYVYWTRTLPPHHEIILTGFDEDSEDTFNGFLDTSKVEILERAAKDRRSEARDEVTAGLRSLYNYAQLAKIDDIESTPHTRALYIPTGKTPLPSTAADAEALGMGAPVVDPNAGPDALPTGGEPISAAGEEEDPAALPPGSAPPALPGAAPAAALNAAPTAPPGAETPAGAARAALRAVAGKGVALRAIEGGRPKAVAAYRLSRKAADEPSLYVESAPDEDAAAALEQAVAKVLAGLSERWTERAAARLASPKQRKGTRHWAPEYPTDTRVGVKALDTAKAVDEATWQAEAEQATHPVILAAAITAATALLIDMGVTPPPGYTLARMAADAVAQSVAGVVTFVGRAAANQAMRLSSEINRLDESDADLDSIVAAIRDRATRLLPWCTALATQVATATINGARDDGAREASRDEGLTIERAWYSRRDDNVRPSHRLADGQVRGLDEPFIVGSSLLMRPGDPTAPVHETANCRCRVKHRSKRTGRFTTQGKALMRDGDGDGFVFDGTVRQMPAPRVALPDLPDASPVLGDGERELMSLAKVKSLFDLRDGKGPVEGFLRTALDRIGIDPYDVDLDALHAHADDHARERGTAGNMAGESRFWFKSPCWTFRDVDYADHMLLPQMLLEKYPELAAKLSATSPRWRKVAPEDVAAAVGPDGKALPRDGDRDGFIYDGTVRQMPAPLRSTRGNEQAIARGAGKVASYARQAADWQGLTFPEFYDGLWSDVQRALATTFGADFTTRTGRVVRTEVKSAPLVDDRKTYEITGVFSDADTGDQIGKFTRLVEIGPKVTVHHTGLFVEPWAQDEGIGTEFTAHQFAWYRHMGVDEVVVSASGTLEQRPKGRSMEQSRPRTHADLTAALAANRPSSNGGYTWGQSGFDWKNATFLNTIPGTMLLAVEAEPDVVGMLRGWENISVVDQTFIEGWFELPFLPSEWWADAANRAMLLRFLDETDYNRPPTPYEINRLGETRPYIDPETGEETWFGKAIMVRSSWLGYFDPKWLDAYVEVKARGSKARRQILAAAFLSSLGSDTAEPALEGKSIREFSSAIAHGLTQVEALLYREPTDGDGDGLVYDNTPRQRPVRPRRTPKPSYTTPAARGTAGGVDRATTGRPYAETLEHARTRRAEADARALARATAASVVREAARPPVKPSQAYLVGPGEAAPWDDNAGQMEGTALIVSRLASEPMVAAGADLRVLDMLVERARALDEAKREGDTLLIDRARERFFEVLARLRDMEKPNGDPVVSEEDLGMSFGELASNISRNAKSVYTDRMSVKAELPRDADGDGFVYDGTPRQRPATPRLAVVTSGRTAAATWARHANGYRSRDGEWFLERQGRMSTGGTNGWTVYRRVPAERIGQDNGAAYDTRDGGALVEVDGTFYTHEADAGSLADAKATVVAADAPPAESTTEDYEQAGYDAAAERFGSLTVDQMRAALERTEFTAGDPDLRARQREALTGAMRWLQERIDAEPAPTTPDRDPDREAVYRAERELLAPMDRMRAITDDEAADIASEHVGERVTILRTDESLGGLEAGRHMFGVWLSDGPVIAVPTEYALSPFEVYHETAHLLTSRGDDLRGHGAEFQREYLRILPPALADRLRPGFPSLAPAPDTDKPARPVRHYELRDREGRVILATTDVNELDRVGKAEALKLIEIMDRNKVYVDGEYRGSYGRLGVHLAGTPVPSPPQGRPDGAGTKDDPIDVDGNFDRAAALIADGRYVRLNRVDEIGTLVTRLAALVKEAEARGEDAPVYDLCMVSVPDTNLFCQQSMGIPRVEMPQLAGKAIAGSPAASLTPNERGNVNVKPQFFDSLTARGVSVENREVPAEWLKATQSQMDGPTVGRISRELREGRFAGSGIVATRDGYLLDGHHQWAAQVAVDSDNGVLGDRPVPVQIIDIEIGEALELAREFGAEQGIMAAGIGVDDTSAAGYRGDAPDTGGLRQITAGQIEPGMTIPDVGVVASVRKKPRYKFSRDKRRPDGSDVFVEMVEGSEVPEFHMDSLATLDVESPRSEVRTISMGPVVPVPKPNAAPAGIYEIDMDGISTTRAVALMYGEELPLAWLTWDPKTSAIEGVYVNEDYRGKGVAAELLRHATELHGAPLLDSGEYTSEGFAWAKRRGIDPKMSTRISKTDMARMVARMNMALWGGGRNGALLEPVGQPAEPDEPVDVEPETPEVSSMFGKRIGAPEKRALPGGGYLLVETVGGRQPGQTIERVLYRVIRTEGVWGAHPPTEQSPAAFQSATKADVERWAMNRALGITDPADVYDTLRRTGRALLSPDERDRMLAVIRRMAKRDGLMAVASLSERGTGRNRMTSDQANRRPTTVNLVRPEDPTTIYAPDA